MKLYGKFTSLIYLSPLLGGYIADRWWGKRKAIIMGAILIAIGQFVMGIQSVAFMYTALGFIIMGNGLFKPNITSVVGELYQKNDPRRDGGFTLFYMGINWGFFMANLIAGTLGEKIGWHWGFWTAGVGMILGIIIFLWGKDKYIRGLGMAPPIKIQSVSYDSTLLRDASDWSTDSIYDALWTIFIFIFCQNIKKRLYLITYVYFFCFFLLLY